MKEKWKDIPNYEGLYQISNLGNILNVKRNKIKKQTINKEGYYYVMLSKKGKKTYFLVHRLVAQVFLDKSKYKCVNKDDNVILVVNHKDENKLNNNLNNLEWCTNKYNVIYSNKRNKINKILNYIEDSDIPEKNKNDLLNIIFS